MTKLLTSVVTMLIVAFVPCRCFAEGPALHLDRQASKVDFIFSSQVINTQGQFTEYDSTFRYDPANISRSSLELTANASGISFGALPIDQMILVTSLVHSLPHSQLHFVSDSFTQRSKDVIVISGTTDSGNKGQRVEIPVTITPKGSGYEIHGIYEHSGLIGNAKNPTSAMFGNTTCKSNFSLVYKK